MAINWPKTLRLWAFQLLVLAAIVWGIRQVYRRFR